jgi:hypothetical protein
MASNNNKRWLDDDDDFSFTPATVVKTWRLDDENDGDDNSSGLLEGGLSQLHGEEIVPKIDLL